MYIHIVIYLFNWFIYLLLQTHFLGTFSLVATCRPPQRFRWVGSEWSTKDSTQNLSFLRVFRVFRLVRVVRLVRTVRSLRSLRTMLFSIISSIAALYWAFVMLLLTMFMFSIIFSNGVASYFDFVDANATQQVRNAELVYESFGGIYETLVSLFSAVSGGNDWMNYGSILRAGPGEVYFLVFVFYIFFCLVGLLNVVTGIFVDSAVCTRTEDEVVESFTEEQTRLCKARVGCGRGAFSSRKVVGSECSGKGGLLVCFPFFPSSFHAHKQSEPVENDLSSCVSARP